MAFCLIDIGEKLQPRSHVKFIVFNAVKIMYIYFSQLNILGQIK